MTMSTPIASPTLPTRRYEQYSPYEWKSCQQRMQTDQPELGLRLRVGDDTRSSSVRPKLVRVVARVHSRTPIRLAPVAAVSSVIVLRVASGVLGLHEYEQRKRCSRNVCADEAERRATVTQHESG